MARRRLFWWGCSLLVGFGLASALWLALAIDPSLLFAYRTERAHVWFHSREPLGLSTLPFLDEAVRRIARSPVYSANDTYDVFLCDSSLLFDFLTLARRGGGLTNPWGNVFIRPGDVAHGRVFDRAGRDRPNDRNLAYYAAHELTHAMTFRRFGFWTVRALAPFQREGYADYVGQASRPDLASGRQRLIAGAPEMDPARSGLYARYDLLVAYLLERRGMSVESLLSTPLDQESVERTFLADSL